MYAKWWICMMLLALSAARSLDQSFLIGKAMCADFNHGVAGHLSHKFSHPLMCPQQDGIAGTFCQDKFPVRNIEDITQSNLNWNEIAFYILIGPKSSVDALMWWLQLLKEPIDLVFVADACPTGETCSDGASAIVNKVSAQHATMVRAKLVRALPGDSGYSILSCKLRTGQKLVYNMFPDRKYYFKFDTDTILFPRRLMQFLNTIDSIALHGHQSPLYFGTMVESGIPQLLCKHHTTGSKWTFNEPNASICYCQGGAGYGLSNVLMKHMANVPSCAATAPSDLPEDLFTALEVYNNFNHTVPIHCGGFRSSELVGDEWFKHSISFHYIDSAWLRLHGHKLLAHYRTPGEKITPPAKDNTPIQCDNNKQLFLYNNDTLSPFNSWDAFVKRGYDLDNVVRISTWQCDNIPHIEPLV